MLDRVIQFSIRQRWLILLVALGVSGLGIYNYRKLPIDAVPDITNVQVQINTEAPGYSPLEAEQRVTFIVETAMGGFPARLHALALTLRPLADHGRLQRRHGHLFARQLISNGSSR